MFFFFLIRLVRLIQELFNNVCIVQMLILTPNMAVSFYAFMKTDPSHKYYSYFILEGIVVISQFLFYCWFGTELTTKVNEIFYLNLKNS